MSLKSTIAQLIRWIKKIIGLVDNETKKLIPIVIAITNGVKAFLDSQTGEFSLEMIKKMVTGPIGDTLIDSVHKWIDENLPDTILKLKLVEAVANIPDPVDKAVAVLDILKKADVSERTGFYINLSAVILVALRDGKLTMAEATVIIQTWYHGEIEEAN